MKNIFVVLCMVLTCCCMQRCANMVAPVGGPKDTQPPVVVRAVPESHSVNFNGKRIEIAFDEYVTLENARQNVLISPPLKVKPDFNLKDKIVVIRFNERLLPNTTYTIRFGEAVRDLHEGNLLKDYIYTFSTGSVLDTLCIGGKLLSSVDMKPVEDAYVTLYAGGVAGLDSLPLTTSPDHIAKTDKEGNFMFTGLADKDYLVFALKDVNSNLYFDMPNEEVAFLDSLVRAVPLVTPKNHHVDTLCLKSADTIPNPSPDTLVEILPDTLHDKMAEVEAKTLTLYMFAEEDTVQRLLEKKIVEEGLLRFAFSRPAQNVKIETTEPLPDTFQLVKVPSPAFDTISWFFTPKVKDSLWVRIQYDSIINDSVHFGLAFRDKKGKRADKEAGRLKISDNIVNGCVMPESVPTLSFSEPLLDFSLPAATVFVADGDTLQVVPEFERVDAFGFKYGLKNPLEPGKAYSISIPDSVLYGMRNRTNEAFDLKFRLASEEDYGNIFITVCPPKDVPQVVVQLLDAKKKVVSEQVVVEQREVAFWYLAPGKYTLRAILDADANGKWSTGNYHRRFLPETMVDYKGELDLKAGWDIDLEAVWEIE